MSETITYWGYECLECGEFYVDEAAIEDMCAMCEEGDVIVPYLCDEGGNAVEGETE